MMEKTKKEKIITIILFTVLLLYTASVVDKTFQNDTYFTITVGNKILNQGFYTDETFTIHEGLKFANIKWLFDTTVAIIYNWLSFEGVYAFTIIIACLIAGSIFELLLKKDVNKVFAFISTVILIYCLRGGLACRAQIVSYLIMIVEYYCINKLIDTGKLKYSVFLVGLSILMANVHGPLFPMFIVIFMPYVAELLVQKIPLFKKGQLSSDSKIYMKSMNKKVSKMFLITFLICSLGGFATPYANTFLAYTDMFLTIGSNLAETVAELQTLTLLKSIEFTIILALSILVLVFSKKIRLSNFLFVLGFGLIGILNTRNTFYFYIFGIISITLTMKELMEHFKFEDNKLSSYIKKYALIILLTLIIGESFIRISFSINKRFHDTDTLCPIGSAEFILANYDINKIRIFNSFNTGGYLEFRGIKVFMDSRAEIYIREFNDTDILADELDFFRSIEERVIKDFFEKYNITHFVMEVDEYLEKKKILDEDWDLVYVEESFVVCEKKDFSEKAVEKNANQ